MYSLDFFTDYSVLTLLSLLILAFVAGFIDAVVGGGGLIQLPAVLISLPATPLPVLFGTNKFASLAGTSVAAWQYAKRIRFNIKLLLCIAVAAFAASYLGAKAIGFIAVSALKPAILVILILIAIYTFFKKDLGSAPSRQLPLHRQYYLGMVIGGVIGFYDGFFGPGTGSFFVLAFVVVLGFDFVKASAYSKLVNCITNLSALIVFVRQGQYLPLLAILLAICNVSGNFIGSRMALKKGNGFVRGVFLIIVVLMIVRYAYDVFVKG
jgi:uncharacterized protein